MQFVDKAIKEQRPFHYPLELDMRKFCTRGALADGWGSTYQLGGIVLHDGGANGGHYWFVQRLDQQHWLVRNDGKEAKKITSQTALAFTREACALLYLRTPPQG